MRGEEEADFMQMSPIVMMILLRMVLSLLISSSRMNIYVAGRNE